jgi:opacity protein-like surface antigen
MPLSDYKTGDKLGWLAGADVTYWLTGGMIGLRAEGSYSQTSHKAPATTGNTKIIGGMADVVWAPGRSADQVRPYVLGGVGFYNAKESISGASSTKIGFGGGAGVAFKMGTGGTRIFAEGKFVYLKINGANFSSIPIRAGVRFPT